jgi:hypothetical protein
MITLSSKIKLKIKKIFRNQEYRIKVSIRYLIPYIVQATVFLAIYEIYLILKTLG